MTIYFSSHLLFPMVALKILSLKNTLIGEIVVISGYRVIGNFQCVCRAICGSPNGSSQKAGSMLNTLKTLWWGVRFNMAGVHWLGNQTWLTSQIGRSFAL